MIVRTYGRRGRGIGRTLSETSLNDDVSGEDPFSFTEDDDVNFPESPRRDLIFTFSSQDSARWTGSESLESSVQLLEPLEEKRPKKERRENLGLGLGLGFPAAATLMETQEYGEMMECVDEVDFALDGLRREKGGGVRVRRASLLALLNVCGVPQQRRLLKAQGMTKTIVNAILDLSLDDLPSNLAAATLFYILTSNDQDNYLLDSSSSILFLLKLLKPVVVEAAVDKPMSISQKLLALQKDILCSQDSAKKLDSSSTVIMHKVLETLVSSKDLKASNVENIEISRPELNPDWISLLTVEKACLSAISLEDTTGTVRKTGGNFKEKLRELGGLDAVFDLVMKFYSTLEGVVMGGSPSNRDEKDGKLQCLPLLLRCLKIMEIATFLSKENQSHLLRLKRKGSSLSFVKLMINFIKILSDLSSIRTTSATSSPQMLTDHPSAADESPELLTNADQQVGDYGVYSLRSSQECCSTGRYSSETGLNSSQSSHWLSSFKARLLPSISGAATRSSAEDPLAERVSSSGSGSCSFMSRSCGRTHVNGHSSKSKQGLGKRPCDDDEAIFIDLEESEGSQDPFAFDEDEFVPSKWDKLSGKPKRRRKQKTKPGFGDTEDGCLSQSMLGKDDCLSQPMLSQFTVQNEQPIDGNHPSSDTSCTTAIDEENSNHVADCLLTAIKVLMNLTNDNAIGCQQIAAFGGLEALSSLIARHFPSFGFPSSVEIKENSFINNMGLEHGSQTDVHLSDQELDFLVTILGLLVNMVENDSDNRSRLAAAKVSISWSGDLNEVHTGMIPLLCSIFLANQGAGEAAEEEQPWDAEEVVLQGEKEAEKMIVEAYAALLLAFLSTESKSIRDSIASYLPDRSLKVLVPVLDRFVTFHLTLNMISPETHKTVSEVIESCRLP